MHPTASECLCLNQKHDVLFIVAQPLSVTCQKGFYMLGILQSILSVSLIKEALALREVPSF